MAKILLVTGPSGVGKTTTCREFLRKAPGSWAYINQDEVRQMVKAGYASADDYEKNWSEDTRMQWEVSIPICIDIAKRYQEAGIHSIIDFFGPPDELESWRRQLTDAQHDLVLLLPNEQTTVIRNAGRSQIGKLKENKIRQNYHHFDDWNEPNSVVMDTSEYEVSEIVQRLSALFSN